MSFEFEYDTVKYRSRGHIRISPQTFMRVGNIPKNVCL